MAAPLTTYFTPPADCSSLTSRSTLSSLWAGRASSCRPESSGDPELVNSPYFYSPGICPYGYRSACPLESTSGSDDVTLRTGEAGHKCCPNGYFCLPNDSPPYYCRSTVSQFLTVPFWNSTTGIYRFISSTVATQTGVYALAIAVKYKPEEITLFPGSLTSGLTRPSQTPPPTITSPIPTTTTPPATTTASTGLPKGAKIAIGVAVPIAVLSLALALGVIYFFRRRARKARLAAAVPPNLSAHQPYSLQPLQTQYVIPVATSPTPASPPPGKPGFYPSAPEYHEAADTAGYRPEQFIVRQ